MDMASSFALRSELRSIVLRGFKRLQAIESVREASDVMLLEARMAESAESPDGTSPSPLEILLQCQAIQVSWSDDEREARMHRTRETVLRTLTPEARRARRLKLMREAQRRLQDRREAAGGSRYKPLRKREVAVLEGGAA